MTSRRLFGTVLPLVLASVTLTAQDQWRWPEEPKNLRILPNEVVGTRLRSVMTGFTRSLGVRCSYCHVGKEGEPLSTYNFVSDDNPNKDRARVMLTMLGDVNTHLKKMSKSSDPPVNMWCHTCHRGRPKPMTLEEELAATYRADGIEPAIAHYTSLKDRYYGKGAYNFGEGGLNGFGYELLTAGNVEGAIRVFTLATTEFPESANAWDSLGEACLKAGDVQNARKHFEKSLELNPRNENARKMLQRIESEKK